MPRVKRGTVRRAKRKKLLGLAKTFSEVGDTSDVEFVPVWIENLSRVMPKGRFVPVPLLCTVTLGVPLTISPGEDKEAFVERTRSALLALAPPEG